MSRTRVIVLAVCLIALGGWMILRPHPRAGAAEPGDVQTQYGANNEENAFQRYSHNAPRHWRQTVTRK